MTEPLEVTDEMRKAVYTADCAMRGHVFSQLGSMLVMDANERFWVGGPAGQRAHLTCQRCGSVWMLAQEDGEEGADYTDAETKFAGKLQDPEHAKPAAKKPKPAPAVHVHVPPEPPPVAEPQQEADADPKPEPPQP
jgi:hypothetical protein